MSATLPPGQRRLPSSEELTWRSQLFPHADGSRTYLVGQTGIARDADGSVAADVRVSTAEDMPRLLG